MKSEKQYPNTITLHVIKKNVKYRNNRNIHKYIYVDKYVLNTAPCMYYEIHCSSQYILILYTSYTVLPSVIVMIFACLVCRSITFICTVKPSRMVTKLINQKLLHLWKTENVVQTCDGNLNSLKTACLEMSQISFSITNL